MTSILRKYPFTLKALKSAEYYNYKVFQTYLNNPITKYNVIKTDAPSEIIDKNKVHKKYKDLSKVEFAFRTIKTTIEEIRPIFARKEQRTRGHVLICMLAYMIIKYITDKLFDLEISRKSIFETLDSIQYSNYEFKTGTIKILPSKFHEHHTGIFERLNIKMPKYL